MMNTIHNFLWALLLLSHTAFLLRAALILRRKEAPAGIDRFLMAASQILLIPAILSTLPLLGELSQLHIICCAMPFLMMFIMARKSFRRRHPALLPLVNEIWIAAALITGFF